MPSHTADRFLKLEAEVWDALAAGDAEADGRLLADGFLGVYGSGFAGKRDHVGQLDGGPTVARYDLSDARIQVLAEDVVLLSYRAVWARLRGGDAGDLEAMYVTSIWRRCGEDWKNVFSQDTPAAG